MVVVEREDKGKGSPKKKKMSAVSSVWLPNSSNVGLRRENVSVLDWHFAVKEHTVR